MSLVAELKRRSVFKVGVAYLVVGWLVIQVAATVSPQLSLPEWAPRLITLVVLLGFPISLVLAWIFDVTPEGVKVDAQGVGSKRVFTAAAILVALAVGWFMGGLGALRGGGEPAAGGPAPAEVAYAAPLGEKSTAVLPFVNMSSDKENEHFSDGLTETLLHKLAQVNQIKVAARTSSFAFKGKQDDIRAIGRQLGVATVVEGSVQRAGDTLRITAQLVKTDDGSHIWSRNYDRKMQDIFAIQDEIAAAVAEALVGALLPEAKAALAKGGTQDLAAYDLYTKGLQKQAINTFGSLTEAETLMQAALARDPKYLDALFGLAAIWSDMAYTGMFSTAELDRRLNPVLDRIEAIDPNNGLLLGYRGTQARRRGDGDAARSLLDRALAALPGDARLHSMSADDWRAARDADKVLAAREAALALDPLNAGLHTDRAFALSALRRFDEAEQAARRAIEVDPRVPTAYTLLGDLAIGRGDLVGGFIGYAQGNRIDPLDYEVAAELAVLATDLGEAAAAEAWIAESRRLQPGNLNAAVSELMLAFGRGEHARVLALATAIVPRHDEERRANWSTAMSAACLSAVEQKRLPELRAALVKARAVPAEYSAEGFRAIATPFLTIDHQIGHIVRMSACYFDAGAAGAPMRERLFATITALKGAGWETGSNLDFLALVLKDDRASQVARQFKDEPPSRGAPRAVRDHARSVANLDYRGLRDVPQFAARRTELAAALVEQRAALPQRLAAEGLSLMPAAAPTKAP
jgi:TolB-like protein/Tfp pilus assembly protein PilF